MKPFHSLYFGNLEQDSFGLENNAFSEDNQGNMPSKQGLI